MKKFLYSVLILISSLNVINIYSEEKYSELVDEYNIYYDMYEKFSYDIEITDDAEQMAGLINTFVDKMEIQIDKIINIKKKYPELDKINKLPDNLKNILIKINKFLKGKKLSDANKKTYKFKSKSSSMENALKRLETLKKRNKS